MSPKSSSTTGRPVLSGAGLTKQYVLERSLLGRPRRTLLAVDGVDLNVQRAETVGIVGESGSGKSTLARLLAQLIDPSAGSVSVLGRNLDGTAATQRWLRRHVQVVLQDPYASLDPTKTVGHAVREPLVVQRIGARREHQAASQALLERVGLPSSYAERFPDELSGGQRQRVAIARALASSPAVIIADEPTSALDLSTRSEILNLLLELQRADGLSLVVISHDFATVRHLSHRLVVMYQGRIVEEGPAAEVTNQPRHPYTNNLVASVPIPDPAVQRHRTRPPKALNDYRVDSVGCPYATRCPAADSACGTDEPPIAADAAHWVRCHHPIPIGTEAAALQTKG